MMEEEREAPALSEGWPRRHFCLALWHSATVPRGGGDWCCGRLGAPPDERF